jgi:hypothetical protein
MSQITFGIDAAHRVRARRWRTSSGR